MKPPVTISDVPARPAPGAVPQTPGLPPLPNVEPPDIDTVYRQHGERIYRYCRAYLRHEADAQDAAQETFVRAAQQLHRVTGDVGAYLTAIARNVCYDHRRSRKNRCVPIDGEERADPRQRPEQEALERSLVDRLLIALNRNDRVLLAHAFAGFTYEEISGITGMSAKAVSVGITRARQRARRAAAVAGVALAGGPTVSWLRRLLSRTEHVRLALTTADQIAVLAVSLAVGMSTGTALQAAPGSPFAAVDDGRQRAAAAALVPAGHSAGRSPLGAEPGSGLPAAPAVSAGAPQAPPPLRPAKPLLDSSAPGPQDAAFTSFTPSPNYSQDHTIFASGYRVGCSSSCGVIFRSSDAGHSWTFVGPQPGGPVILPPSFPADRTLYVTTGTGLARSDDGGASFRIVAPIIGPGAVVPGAAAGAAQIVVAGSQTPQLWVYSEADDRLNPGPVLPMGLLPDSLVFADAGHFVVAAHSVAQNAPALASTSFVSCTLTACQTAATMAGYTPGIQFVPVPSGSPAVVAYAGSRVFVLRDAGKTVQEAAGIPGTITAGSFYGPSTAPILVLAYNRADASGGSALAASRDEGASFVPLPQGFAGPTVVTTLGGMVDGRLLAYLSPGGSEGLSGLRCSTNGAQTWAWSC